MVRGDLMEELINTLNENYPILFSRLEFVRDMGSTSYILFSNAERYFLRVIKPSLADTAITGADIQVYLQERGFPVPPIILTNENQPYVRIGDRLLILYAFIEGSDCDPEQDVEAIGALTGRLHQMMKAYPGELVKRDKRFYIDRYLEILRKKQYPRIEEYIQYGDSLWESIKDLPRGYCHGDLYEGNIRKASDGQLYIHDFDTSCQGFPMYDPTLICDMTQYFDFDARNFDRSNQVLARFIPAYQKYNDLSQAEIDAFHALVAIEHFSTQATVMELFGLDCIDRADMDNQLEWLYRWRDQSVTYARR